MNGISRIALLVLLMAGVLVGGCDKKFELTFVNLTAQNRDLHIDSPNGPESLGVIPAGGKVEHDLKLDKDFLPSRMTVQAGDVTGEFALREHMEKKQWIDIKIDGTMRIRNKNVLVNETTTIETPPVRTHSEIILD